MKSANIEQLKHTNNMHSIKIKGKQPLTSKCPKTLLGATQELATHM